MKIAKALFFYGFLQGALPLTLFCQGPITNKPVITSTQVNLPTELVNPVPGAYQDTIKLNYVRIREALGGINSRTNVSSLRVDFLQMS